MIEIRKSQTADTRTCDFANTSKQTLLESSVSHIGDVAKGLAFFQAEIGKAIGRHDTDKLTDIDGFHADFVTGFKVTDWWDRHRTLNRHHLFQADGVPADVNLIDVLDLIADCVMAGMGRSGSVYALDLDPRVLMKAFTNTVDLLRAQVEVVSDDGSTVQSRRDAAVMEHLCKLCRCGWQMGPLQHESHCPALPLAEAWERASKPVISVDSGAK